MTTIKIERIPKESIDTTDKTKWNSNNHPIKPEDIPKGMTELEHYKSVIAKTCLSDWKHLVDYEHTITLSKEAIQTLIECIPTGMLSRRRPKNFKEDLEDLEKEISKSWPYKGEHHEKSKDWFVRSDRVSLKDGVVAYPFSSPKDLVDAMSTSDRFHKALKDGDNKLYFFEYQPTWNEFREVRVFVHDLKVTAMSQYLWFRKGYFGETTDQELEIVARNIIHSVEDWAECLYRKNGLRDMTVDVYVNDESLNGEYESQDSIRLVEFNTFGYSQAAGSCLFHWLNDYDILYGKMNTKEKNNVVFRIVS